MCTSLPNTRWKGGLYELRSVGKKNYPASVRSSRIYTLVGNDSFGGIMGLLIRNRLEVEGEDILPDDNCRLDD